MTQTTSGPPRDEFILIYLLAVNRLTMACSALKSAGRTLDPLTATRLRNLRASCEVLQRLAFPDVEGRY